MSEPVGDDLAITAVPSPGATVLMVTGSLDWRTAGTLRRAVGDHVADGRTRLVLDLGGLDFCDAAGLGALVAALRTTRNAGGWLRLARAGPRIARLLGITGLDDILPVHHGVTEAIGSDPAPAGLGAMR